MHRKILLLALPLTRPRQRIPIYLLQRLLLMSFLIIFSFLVLLLFGEGLCGDLYTADIRYAACQSYKDNLYSEPFCEELCSRKNAFNDFKCVFQHPRAVTASRNGHVIAIHYPDHPKKSLSWQSSTMQLEYPQKLEFYNMIKWHLLVNYNVTLREKVSKFPYTEAIDENKHEEMEAYWMLLNWNDYVMFKLFEDEELFPKILGNCGPFFISERLMVTESIENYKSYKKQQYFEKLLEYVLRLDAMQPDPLKICHISVYDFGLTGDLRLKAHNSNFIILESQLNKLLANGDACTTDADCKWHDCLGVCDKEKRICSGAQKHSNLKLLCDYVAEHPETFPELSANNWLPVTAAWQLYTQHCWQKNTMKITVVKVRNIKN